VIDTSNDRQVRKSVLIAGAIALCALVITMILPPFTKLFGVNTSILSVHMLMEMFAIVIAMLVVTVSWHTFDAKDTRAANFFIVGFTVVAACDMVHALSYDGMPAFLTVSGTPRAIFFWLIGRSVEVLTMVLVLFHPAERRLSRGSALALGIGIALALVWFGTFHLELFPATFISGIGVTPFKAQYEYALCGLNLLVALLMWRRAGATHDARFYLLSLSSFVMGIGEIAFTAYVTPSDFQNVFGHAYKLVAYALLYRATFVLSIRLPFEELRSSESRLRESELRMRSISNNLPNCVVYQLEINAAGVRRFIHISEAVRNVNGLQVADVMRDPAALYAQIVNEDLVLLAAAEKMSMDRMELFDVTVRLRRADGQLRWVNLSSAPRPGVDGAVLWDGVELDITDRIMAAEEINRLGYFDSLTGMPNRRLLLERLGQAINECSRGHWLGAMILIDLVNFKDFNDTQGHDQGDRLLKSFGLRLMQDMPEAGTISRMGGDEFVVLLPALGEDVAESARLAQEYANRMLAGLQQAFVLDSKSHFVSINVGITLFGSQTKNVEEVLGQVDLALYEAKIVSPNTLRFFDPQMHAMATLRLSLEGDLREAILREQFVLHYQPQVREDGELIGAEALIRWQHPDKGLISPLDFIPIAESTGLIIPIGDWVIATACERLHTWSANPATVHLTISVNVSARQFQQPDFVAKVLACLDRSGANPQRLKLELTESLLAQNMEDLIVKMDTLGERGVRFSLDDFGTGYSSLSYLKRLPLHQLKIDQSFVRDVLSDPNDAAIAKMVIALSQAMGLSVIAEGVETVAQKDFLAANGCMAYQGYLFGRPMPVEQLEEAFAMTTT
jgi:diguanylate cyclase (GGDEF)-like protein